MAFSTNVAPGAAGYGNTSMVVATSTDGRIYYNWWELGQGGQGWRELDGGGRTNAAPAASFRQSGDSGFVVSMKSAIKGLDGNIYTNEGGFGSKFDGWVQQPGLQTNVAPAAAFSKNGPLTIGGYNPVLVATATDGRIFYYNNTWVELDGNGRTNAAPAAALVGDNDDYLFVVVKGLDGNLYLNQGQLGQPFVGWQSSMEFTTNVAPGATSAGNTSVTVVTHTDGRIYYNWWELGQGGQGWRELDGGGRTDASPAAALVGDNHDYLFVVVKGLDGNLYLNQGQLGQPFVGWQSMS